jgi:hypothetical protein
VPSAAAIDVEQNAGISGSSDGTRSVPATVAAAKGRTLPLMFEFFAARDDLLEFTL